MLQAGKEHLFSPYELLLHRRDAAAKGLGCFRDGHFQYEMTIQNIRIPAVQCPDRLDHLAVFFVAFSR